MSAKKWDGKERRRFARINSSFIVNFRLHTSGINVECEEWSSAVVSNFSAGGLLFKTKSPMKKGDVIELRFGFPAFNELFQCFGRVLRTTPCDDEIHYSTATGFLNVTDQMEARMNRVVLASQGTNPKALIVDDEIHGTIVYKAIFERLGYTVLSASSEPEVLDKCRLHQPHLVYIDGSESYIDRVDICGKIRKLAGEETMIIICSTNGPEKGIEDVFEAGARFFLIRKKSKEHIYKTLAPHLFPQKKS